jgi:hypothetical protein
MQVIWKFSLELERKRENMGVGEKGDKQAQFSFN